MAPSKVQCPKKIMLVVPDFVNAVEYPHERGFDITDNRLWYSDTKTQNVQAFYYSTL